MYYSPFTINLKLYVISTALKIRNKLKDFRSKGFNLRRKKQKSHFTVISACCYELLKREVIILSVNPTCRRWLLIAFHLTHRTFLG